MIDQEKQIIAYTLPAKTDDKPLVSTETQDALTQILRHAIGAYTKNTVRAWGGDFRIFALWCHENGHNPFPTNPDTLAAFVDDLGTRIDQNGQPVYKAATIRRYVASISAVHRMAGKLTDSFAGIENPVESEKVRLAIRRASRALGTRQKQAGALNRDHVEKMLTASKGTLRDTRDTAMLSIAYDTLARRSELVAIHVEDVTIHEDGSGHVILRKTKTDQEGHGHIRFIAPDTTECIKTWLDESGLTDGPLFRGINNADRLTPTRKEPGDEREKGLSAQGFYRAIKRFAKRAGLNPKEHSGHSLRVGSAQDMVTNRLSLAGVMQAGGWKSPTMVARYTERIEASRGAAAELAKIQGRR